MNDLENLVLIHALQYAIDNQIIPHSLKTQTRLEEISGLGRDVNGNWVRKALEYALLADERDMSAEGKSFIREMMLKHDL